MDSQQIDVVTGTDVWAVVTGLGSAGAAIVALGIALWSERSRRRDALEAQLRDARNVVVVGAPRIVVINASTAPILDVSVSVGMPGSGEPLQLNGDATWSWHAGPHATGAGSTPLIMPSGRYEFPGYWVETKADATTNWDVPDEALTDILTDNVLVIWTDPTGDRWMKRGGGYAPRRLSRTKPALSE